jgi:hypothetical protein
MAKGRSPNHEEAKNHHFLPVFYLKGFTLSGGKSGRLWTHNLSTGERELVKPKQVGHSEDLYRVDVQGFEATAVEDDLDKRHDDKAAPVLEGIVRPNVKSLPTGDDYAAFISFIALTHARNPREREVSIRVAEPVIKAMGAAKRDVGEGKQEVGQNYLIRQMYQTFRQIEPLLMQREWSLLVRDSDAGEFICSDCPVVLRWEKPDDGPPWMSPGFGQPETIVTMPLSRDVAVLGRFGGWSHTIRAHRRMVAEFNRVTLSNARQFLFTAREDFDWLVPGGEIAGAADLMASWASLSSKGEA